LSELGVNISAARICTEKGAAVDTFYATEQDGTKIKPDERWRKIERTLISAIQKLNPN
jgi:[protein-PII] uridylyltransferase